jgi:hypothetical protein
MCLLVVAVVVVAAAAAPIAIIVPVSPAFVTVVITLLKTDAYDPDEIAIVLEPEDVLSKAAMIFTTTDDLFAIDEKAAVTNVEEFLATVVEEFTTVTSSVRR